MPVIFKKPIYKRWWIKLLAIIIIFPLSFTLTDYYTRGYLYYSKRIVNDIHRETWQELFPPTGPMVYTLRVVVDQEYRTIHPKWQILVEDEIEEVNSRFTGEFEISFVTIDISEWDIPVELDSYSDVLTYAARNVNRKGADILVIYTGMYPSIGINDHMIEIGVAHYLGNCVVIGDESQLLHEMGHLFGAIDYPPGDPNFDTRSIYSYKYTRRTKNIDTENMDRIMNHKYRFIW